MNRQIECPSTDSRRTNSPYTIVFNVCSKEVSHDILKNGSGQSRPPIQQNAYLDANVKKRRIAYITREVKDCSATLPECSSGNLVGWPSLSENKSSTHESIVPDIHQRIDCKETATAEISSQHGVSTHNQYNPGISDFPFPGTPAVEENESKSIYVQQTSEASNVFKYKNFLYSDAGTSGFEANNPMSLADQSFLPGFQQAFGRRNALMNRMPQHNKDLSQIEYSQPSDASNQEHPANIPMSLAGQSFLPEFQQTFGQMNAVMNRMHQHPNVFSQMEYSGTTATKEVPYSTGNLIHPTNIAEQTEPFSFTTLTFDDPLQNLPFSTNKDDNNPTNKQCTEFSYGITNSDSYARNSNQTHQHNFGREILTSSTELRTWEYSSSVTYSSENQKACNISTTTTANDSNAIHKNHSDKIFSRNVNSSKNLDTPGNARKQSYRRILPKDLLVFPVARRYKCNFCDKTYSRRSNLNKHVRTHNGDKPYQCTECDKSYDYPYQLRDHNYKHTGEKPHSCGECGKCFADKSNLRVHLRSHTGERPFACNKCSKRYFQNVDLKCHMLKRAEERRKCDSCGTEFSPEDSPEGHKCTKNK
ncbi:hypothetical protein CEXT_423011 [Caerostris extrusa]|uniref:C2H2-type domain-containing protein n=1 Tax=Caerostris extrusa TaxID=172846 RepID=A0AAV4R7U6_CAEEX|nr:hypothetical protein CEXT_423011 [Caerostris extrusa]